MTGVLVFLLHCLDYLAYGKSFIKTHITTAMQISRISQYHNVQNGEDTLFKTYRTKYAVAVCRNRLLFVKEHSFRYHYLIVLNFMLYYINEHHSWNVVEKYAMQKNRKNDYISYSKDIIDIFIKIWMIRNVPHDPYIVQSDSPPSKGSEQCSSSYPQDFQTWAYFPSPCISSLATHWFSHQVQTCMYLLQLSVN